MKRFFAIIIAIAVMLSTSTVVYAETVIDSDAVYSEYNDFDDDTAISDDEDAIDDTESALLELPRVVDTADLLTDDEETELESYIDDIISDLGFDIAVVTVDSLEGLTAEAYADDFYDYNGYGYGANHDGCLLLVSMETREWHISTTGYGITALTDAGLDYIADEFLPYLSDGEYYDAFVTFVDNVNDFVLQADTGDIYDIGNLPDESNSSFNFEALLFGLVAGLIVALVFVSVLVKKMKPVASKADANDYLVADSFVLTHESERFIGSSVSKVAIQSESSGGGSSTHSGSSGTSHGGSGGHF